MDRKLLIGGMIIADEILKADLLIEGDKISRIGHDLKKQMSDDCQIIDVSGKLIMPGIIDAHTHYKLKSRDTVTADDFYTGSISAAFGGVTTFIDYADHLKDRTLKEAAEIRIKDADEESVLDFHFHQTITEFDQTVSRELEEIKELGISSIKIFTTYQREGYMIATEKWEQLFYRLKELELLVTVHAEDDQLIRALEGEYRLRGQLSCKMHPEIRPAQAEALAIKKVGKLAQKIDMPLYIVHLSSDEGYQVLKDLKKMGGAIFGETTPHYLLLDQNYLLRPFPAKYLMTPPLRTIKDQQALWQGLKENDIQLVATDHCAFNLAQKGSGENCIDIFPGIPGSETLLPLIHHFGKEEGLSYTRLVEVLAKNPARIFGLYPEKGSLKIGTDADLIVFDPNKRVKLKNDNLHSRAEYSPYQEFEVKGYPVMTILRGQIIVKDGKFLGNRGDGRFIKGDKSSLFI